MSHKPEEIHEIQIQILGIEIKIYWYIATLIHFPVVKGSFQAKKAELNSSHNTSSLVLHEKFADPCQRRVVKL